MKQFLHKILSLAMAFVVLFSTMSFTVNMHYCGKTLVEAALLHKAKGCGMEMEQATSQSCSISKKNCCEDKQLTIEGQDELQLQVDKISIDQQIYVVSFNELNFNFFDGLDHHLFTFLYYKPPLLVRHLYKIDESYLI